MDQGTNAWLEWRKGGIGSSDAPVVMGVSPYKTPYQLYLERRGESIYQKSDPYILEKGHRIERQARALCEIQNEGIAFPPMLCQMIDYPQFKASMDGINFEANEAREFKFVGKKEFDEGICPARYWPQIQHQYMVTGIGMIKIVLCAEIGKHKNLRIKEIYVPMDLAYIQNKLVPGILEFLWKVEHGIPPELQKGDAVRVKDRATMMLIKRYHSNMRKINAIKSLEAENEEILLKIARSGRHALMVHHKTMFRRVETMRPECL